MRLLVTRPEPQGEQTAQALRARGHDVILAPLMRIESLPADFSGGPWDGAVVTSANAIHVLRNHPRLAEFTSLKLFAVGARTAAAAREAGFANVLSADGDAAALTDLIVKTLPPQTSLLYLAGEDRSADLAAALKPARMSVHTVEVYRAVAERALPQAALSALQAGTIDGVLHFSRRSAQTFLDALAASETRLNSLNCHHFCLSSQVAEAFAGEGAVRISVAARADEAAVLDLVGHG